MAKIRKLFGTDGIRGTANQFPMQVDVVMKVGQALGYLLRRQPMVARNRRLVVIGKDTRLSGYMVEQALSSGLNSMGVHVQLVGPLPTPGVGFLVQNMRADAGVVISASHNAFYDNGIKIFGSDGFKISAEIEQEIERLVSETDLSSYLPKSESIGRSKRIEDASGRYIVHVKNAFPLAYQLDGTRIVLDCANGAAYKVAPAILEELGAEVIVLGNTPNGININDKVGALYPERVSESVQRFRADVGISLDGDADRVIMVDEEGHVVNGDHILAICGIYLKEQGCLPHDTVVATDMSNIGLDQVLARHGVRVVRTCVGDKYVVEEMKKNGYALGGEQSGHLIFLEHATTGDGLVAALNLLAVMKARNAKLSVLSQVMDDVPQVLVNVRVKERRELSEIPGYEDLVSELEEKLGKEGRIFVRFSGTEPLLRILVEGPDPQMIAAMAETIAEHVQKH
jgi:phosphoglucosamine mutase